jgi:hypothetical protein
MIRERIVLMKFVLLVVLILTACSNSHDNSVYPSQNGHLGLQETPGQITSRITESIESTFPSPKTITGEYVNFIEYSPTDWNQLFNQGVVVKIIVAPNQEIWLWSRSDRDKLFSLNKGIDDAVELEEIGLPGTIHDISLSHDGVIWAAGKECIFVFRDGYWDNFLIPDASEFGFQRMAVDSTGKVYITTDLGETAGVIQLFDGTRWEELLAPYQPSQLVFTGDNILWASFGWPIGIGKFDRGEWEFYSGKELWTVNSESISSIRIAISSLGNVFALMANLNLLVKIDTQGNITTIPFSDDFELFEFRLRLFVDSKENIWMNACLLNHLNSCLVYYSENRDRWYSFINLPFTVVADINELSDGSILIATENGLYQYNPND